jgi:hypothetical protein
MSWRSESVSAGERFYFIFIFILFYFYFLRRSESVSAGDLSARGCALQEVFPCEAADEGAEARVA